MGKCGVAHWAVRPGLAGRVPCYERSRWQRPGWCWCPASLECTCQRVAKWERGWRGSSVIGGEGAGDCSSVPARGWGSGSEGGEAQVSLVGRGLERSRERWQRPGWCCFDQCAFGSGEEHGSGEWGVRGWVKYKSTVCDVGTRRSCLFWAGVLCALPLPPRSVEHTAAEHGSWIHPDGVAADCRSGGAARVHSRPPTQPHNCCCQLGQHLKATVCHDHEAHKVGMRGVERTCQETLVCAPLPLLLPPNPQLTIPRTRARAPAGRAGRTGAARRRLRRCIGNARGAQTAAAAAARTPTALSAPVPCLRLHRSWSHAFSGRQGPP